MEWFSQQHQIEILDQLEKMEFLAADKILSRAEEMEDWKDPSVKACIFDELMVTEQMTADLFFIIKERSDTSWQIDGVIAWVQIRTERTEEGFMDVQKVYLLEDGPLPTIEQIKGDISALVSYEEYVEFFFMRNDLDREFTRVGFPHYREMLKTAQHSNNMTYMAAAEEITQKGWAFRESVHFQFVIVSDLAGGSATIALIKAYLASNGPNAQQIKDETETGFYAINGQFPSKDSMVREVLSRVKMEKERYEEVKNRFSQEDSKIYANGQRHYQERLQ